MANVSFDLVYVNGVVDVDASLDLAKSALNKFVADKRTQDTDLHNAVHAVFDEHLGSAIAMPALVSLTLAKLNVQPENYKSLGDKVTTFVRERSGDKGSASFSITKGRGGGVKRWSDCE